MAIIKKYWFLIVGLIGAIFFGWERSKRKEAEAALETAEADKKDAVLEEKQKELERQRAAAIAIAEVEKGRKLSPAEMEEFLKKL